MGAKKLMGKGLGQCGPALQGACSVKAIARAGFIWKTKYNTQPWILKSRGEAS